MQTHARPLVCLFTLLAAPLFATSAHAAPSLKLKRLGIGVAVPSTCTAEERDMDMGGVQATIGCSDLADFFISDVNEYSNKFEREIKEQTMVNAAREWKTKTQGSDGTWKLVWTSDDRTSPGKLNASVYYRIKVGKKLFDCGTSALKPDQITRMIEICSSVKAAP